MANLKELYSEKVIKAMKEWYLYTDATLEKGDADAAEAAECLDFYDKNGVWWMVEVNPSLDAYPIKVIKKVDGAIEKYGRPLDIKDVLEPLLEYTNANGVLSEKVYYTILLISSAMNACSHYLGGIDELGLEVYTEEELVDLLAVIEITAKELDQEEDLDELVSEDPIEYLIKDKLKSSTEEDLKLWRGKTSLELLKVFNRLPYGASYLINLELAKSIRKDKIKVRTLIKMLNEVKPIVKDNEDFYGSAFRVVSGVYRIANTFRDIQKCVSWIKRFDTVKEAGEAIPNIINPIDIGDKWRGKLLKKPSLSNYLAFMSPDNEDMEIDDFMGSVAEKLYPGLSREVGILAIEYSVEEMPYKWFFEEHAPKKVGLLPEVRISNKAYTLNKVRAGDPIAVFLGEATDCCQHPEGVGEDCVVDGWSRETSDFYVFKKGDMVIAQTWAWVNGKTIVLDSIEGFRAFANQVTTLVIEFAKEVKALGYEVRVGDTNFGLTPHILKQIKHESVEAVKYEGYKGYTDAKKQVKLLV